MTFQDVCTLILTSEKSDNELILYAVFPFQRVESVLFSTTVEYPTSSDSCGDKGT